MSASNEEQRDDFDLICLGSGTAGQHATIQVAELGKRVAEIREHESRIVHGHLLRNGVRIYYGIGQVIMDLGGGLAYRRKTVFNYPPLAECYKVAALDAFNKMSE